MIVETFLISDDSIVILELTPETIEEEKSLRNAKVLHKNNLRVCWGDTLELKSSGKYIGYSGLKISFKLPKEDKSNVIDSKDVSEEL